jgi:hypothetical protein
MRLRGSPKAKVYREKVRAKKNELKPALKVIIP